MATSVTQSLFGMTPEALQSQRAAALDQQALQFAQMTPMQQAQMGLFRAGSQLGTGLAGLMGYQDPEMQRIKARQGLLGGIDMSDPAALRQAAQAAQQSGDFAAAQELINRANEVALSQAQVGKETALMTKAESEAQAKQAEIAAKNLGIQGRAQFIKRRMPDLSDIEATALASDEAVARELLKDPQAEFKTQDVDGRVKLYKVTPTGWELVQDLGASKPPASTTVNVGVSPQIKMAPDVVSAINAFDEATKSDQTMLEGAQRSKALINEAVTSNNSQTWEAARTTIAKTVGQDKLSNEDIRRTGVDPRLVQGALDWFNKKTVGVPGPDIQRQLYVLASILEQDATKRIDKKSKRAQTAAAAAGFPGDPNLYFPPASPQGAGGAVDWNSLSK